MLKITSETILTSLLEVMKTEPLKIFFSSPKLESLLNYPQATSFLQYYNILYFKLEIEFEYIYVTEKGNR